MSGVAPAMADTTARKSIRAADSPEEAISVFSLALSRRDGAAAAACFAPQGCLLTPDGTSVSGVESIREVLASLVAGFVKVQANAGRLIVTGDTALCSQRWQLASAAVEGEELEHLLDATLVLRKLADGWRIQIAAPWGI